MTDELTFQQGIEEAVSRLMVVTRRPIMAAVYGWQANGKSRFISELRNIFRHKGLEVADYGGGPDKSNFENYRDHPQHYRNMLLLFHCAWNRSTENGGISCTRHEEDPNVLAEQVLGRSLDLNVGIYDPKRVSRDTHLSGLYDFVIRNEH